jgi:4a-hydroxytetrahydrobiopterin dehydratase
VDRTPLTPDSARAALAELPDWRGRVGALHAAFRLPSPGAALELVAAVGDLAQELDHHPDVDWRYDHVFVTSTTHSAGRQVSALDVALARRVSGLAQSLGAQPRPDLPRTVEIGVDARDPSAVAGAWRAALGYAEHSSGTLYDPFGRGPSVWFQVTDDPAPSRLHLDVSVAAEVAEGVVEAAVAAGARRDDTFAPSWVVLTDAAGDRLCICTPEGRADPTS